MRLKIVLITLFIVVTISAIYGVYKPLPDGLNYQSPTYRIDNSQIGLLTDITQHHNNQPISEQTIFDHINDRIANAHDYVLVDMFLFNDQLGQASQPYRALSTELANTIAAFQNQDPDHQTIVITDPINTAYGSYYPEPLQILQTNNVPLVITDLQALRDSNPLYSGWYRLLLQFTPDFDVQWLPNPFDPEHPKTTLGSYWRAFNFKANHRKTLLTNSVENSTVQWHGLVTSFNPHDGSSRHSNIAVTITDHPILNDLYMSEAAVLKFSPSSETKTPDMEFKEQSDSENDMSIQLVTEKAIKDAALNMIAQTTANDRIDLAMFYLSDRDIIKALKDADDRAVQIRVLLDPNRDAFGREKNGIPNRPVAHELTSHTAGNTTLRWCATNGEQCHSKLLRTEVGEVATVLLGSANFTRRNLENYNLETNIWVQGTVADPWQKEVQQFFLDQWNNANGHTYSLDYEEFADDSWLKTIWYRIGEFTGISHY